MSRHRALRPLALSCAVLLVACAPDTPSAPAAASTDTAPPPDASAAVTAGAPAATPDIQPLYRQLRDFTVACDNGLRCEILGVSDDGDFGLVLRLRRDAGHDGGQRLRLESQGGAVMADALRLDGTVHPALQALPWQVDDADVLVLDDGPSIARFIDLVGDGTRLTSGDGDGDGARTLSLAGLRAALLLVDEQQQRLDTPDAWQRRGERDTAAVPAAPALPRPVAAPAPPPLSDADAARLVRTVREASADVLRDADCDAPREGFDIREQDEAQPLDATHALVLTACFSGAYQTSSLVFRVGRDGSDITRIVPPSPPHLDDVKATPEFALLTNAGYDPATATLSHFAKGRGLADCGESAYWVFDGTRLVLGGYTALRRCGGVAPGDWPTLWRSAE